MSRMRMIRGAMGVALSVLAVAGCGQQRISGTEAAGAALGAAAGGMLGTQLGGGWAQMAFTVGGVALGGVTGHMIGRRFEASDRALYGRALTSSLSTVPDGETVHWQNPETGLNGTIRPTRSYHRGNDGQLCRDFRAAVNFSSDVATESGTACQMADGQWILISEAFG